MDKVVLFNWVVVAYRIVRSNVTFTFLVIRLFVQKFTGQNSISALRSPEIVPIRIHVPEISRAVRQFVGASCESHQSERPWTLRLGATGFKIALRERHSELCAV